MADVTENMFQSGPRVVGTCPTCGADASPGGRFCPSCGGAFAADASAGSRATSTTTAEPDPELIPLPEMHGDTVSVSRRRRRRRRRRPLYRRPLVIVPTLLLLLILGVTGLGLYRANSVMTSLRTISTPPPEITDSTYIGEDDPALEGGPITVDTGPARQTLAEAGDRNLPQPQEGGIGGNLQNFTSGVGDVVSAASLAAGGGDDGAEGFTLLVMGVDARPGAAIDIGVRPDVLMLIHFDPEQRSCRMLSIPRDTRVELPGYGKTKINHALMVGGIPYQMMITEDFTDVPIDHYLLIDFVAFREIVDVLGGVQVNIPEDLEKNGKISYEAGSYDFDGDEALAYARFRTFSDDGDLSRVERQWSILAGLAREAKGRNLINDVNNFVPAIEEHMRTDLTLTEMTALARDYGNGCLSADRDDIAKLEGTRVKFEDPILDKVDYYNMVTDSTVRQRVDDLLGATVEPAERQATSGATPAASPAATPAGSGDENPRQTGTPVGYMAPRGDYRLSLRK